VLEGRSSLTAIKNTTTRTSGMRMQKVRRKGNPEDRPKKGSSLNRNMRDAIELGFPGRKGSSMLVRLVHDVFRAETFEKKRGGGGGKLL